MQAPEALDVLRYTGARVLDILVLNEASRAASATGGGEGDGGGREGGGGVKNGKRCPEKNPSRHLRRRPSSLKPRNAARHAGAPGTKGERSEGGGSRRKRPRKDGNGVPSTSHDTQRGKSSRASRRSKRDLLNARCVTRQDESPSTLVASGNERMWWLETHIWYAKRTVMEEMWGISMPRRNQRGLRSLAKAVNNHAVLEDASYYRTLEMQGSEQDLVKVIALVSDSTRPPFHDTGTHGAGACCVLFHHPGMFPQKCVGPGHVLWKKAVRQDEEDDNRSDSSIDCVRKLWLWTHPSIFSEVRSILEMSTAENKLQGRIHFQNVPIVHLKIQGKFASEILGRVLIPANKEEVKRLLRAGFVKGKFNFGAEDEEEGGEQSCEYTLLDPRELYFAAGGQTSLSLSARTVSEAEVTQPLEATSATLWEEDERKGSTQEIENCPDHQINRARFKARKSEELGGESQAAESLLTQSPLRIPALIFRDIEGPRKEKGLWGEIIHLMLPPGWAMPFWRVLVFAGARALSHEEVLLLELEKMKPSFPRDFPETGVGRVSWAESHPSLCEGVVARLQHHAVAFGPSALESPQLAMPTKVCISAVFFRGVASRGSRVYVANKEDYDVWRRLYGHCGVEDDLQLTEGCTKDLRPLCPSLRTTLGYVTSAGYSASRGHGIALCLCEAVLTQKAFQAAREYAFTHEHAFLVLVEKPGSPKLLLGRAHLTD